VPSVTGTEGRASLARTPAGGPRGRTAERAGPAAEVSPHHQAAASSGKKEVGVRGLLAKLSVKAETTAAPAGGPGAGARGLDRAESCHRHGAKHLDRDKDGVACER